MPFGKLYEFDIYGRANWDAYVKLVEQFIMLNDIKRELRVATLVTHVGAATYQVMCDLCSPKHPEEQDFKELVKLVRDHLEPKRSEIAERHVFRQRRQAEMENVGIFLQNLKHLATYCNFGNYLEENLRDQFVSGLRSEEMRSRLFAEPALDYKRAVELALALEAAERHADTAAVGSSGGVADPGPAPHCAPGDTGLGQGGGGLHRVAVPGGSGAQATGGWQRPACWRCGRQGHVPNKCRFKLYMCNKCSEKGHLAHMCSINLQCSMNKDRYKNYYIAGSDSDASDGLL